VFRPRTIIYLSALGLAAAVMIVALILRPGLGLSVQHDRAPLFVMLASGDIRDGYTVKIVNKSPTQAIFEISTQGMHGATLTETNEELGPAETLGLPVPGDSVGTFRIMVTGQPAALVEGSQPIDFSLRDTTTGELTVYHSVFMGPVRRR
jgi:polyferredoxin